MADVELKGKKVCKLVRTYQLQNLKKNILYQQDEVVKSILLSSELPVLYKLRYFYETLF